MGANKPETGHLGTRINGNGVAAQVTDERAHFYLCKSCGQAVDMRDLGQVLHHESVGHSPLLLNS